VNTRLLAFDFLAGILRNEQPSEHTVDNLRIQIRTGQPDWEHIVSLANDYLLTPAMWLALKHKHLIDDLPGELADYLGDLYQLNVERNRNLRAQLLEAVRQLNQCGITPILLKGAKHLVTDIYSGSGARVMTDLDLLVPRENITASLDALRKPGYKPVEDKQGDYHEEHHHCPPLFRPGDYGTLEIHRRLAEYPYERVLPTEQVIAEAEPLVIEEASMKILSPTHRVLHNIVHSQLINHLYDNGIIPLRSLHEVASEQSAHPDQVDWETIKRHMNAQQRGRVLNSYLFMENRLFSMPLPHGLHPGTTSRLYYQRCRAQLASETIHRWGLRYGRYSADMLNERYECGYGWLAINRARLRRLSEKLSSD